MSPAGRQRVLGPAGGKVFAGFWLIAFRFVGSCGDIRTLHRGHDDSWDLLVAFNTAT
jgi:hypothetical protein